MMKVSEGTRDRLKRLAAGQGKTMQAFLEELLEAYEERVFFDELQAAYARLREDRPRWEEHTRELSGWDGVLADGLQEWPVP
jgi:hypothetical protein